MSCATTDFLGWHPTIDRRYRRQRLPVKTAMHAATMHTATSTTRPSATMATCYRATNDCGYTHAPLSVVYRRAADLMVRLEQSLGEQRAHVTAAQPVHDALAAPLALD